VASAEYPDSVVDTGTSIFILPTTTFNAVTQAIASTPAFRSIFGGGADAGASTAAEWFDNPENCTKIAQTKTELDAMLPPLTLVFGSSPSISVQALPTESYLASYDGLWCPTLYSMSPSPDFPLASLMGSPVLRSNIVIFDRANQRIGFAPHASCP
jgi:hypothetical protein